jgi:D-proline reductase (dithiol) PrdB
MSDAEIRVQAAQAPVPEFDGVAWTTPPPLEEAVVAIVTTAGIHPRGGDLFSGMGDQSFRLVHSNDSDLVSSHVSPNFDLTGFVADLNTVLPVDRLRELERDGVIGGVSPAHVSFMGGQGWNPSMTTLRLDSGPAAGQLLRARGVDVVLLTPV